MPTRYWSKQRLLKLALRLGMPHCKRMSKAELLEHLLDAYA
jgi:hypothetical protein